MVNQCQHSTICLPAAKQPRVVVIGAGFAGINLIKRLRNKPVDVVLLDKNNFHQFQPLLYQVAIAGLEPDSIVTPIRKLFQGYINFTYRMAEVIKIESERNRVLTDIGYLGYDFLVIATGSQTNYFGSRQIEACSVGMKDLRDALNIRSWILENLEKATITCDMEEKNALTNFVIVGGGPAGVELAGTLAEFRRYLLQKDYPEIAKEWMKIYLVEAAGRILGTLSEKSSEYALKTLEKLGIVVLLNTMVRNYDGERVMLDSGHFINARTFIWTAGVEGTYPPGLPQNVISNTNRLLVDKMLRVKGYDHIFAIGDVAEMHTDCYPKGHPMLAPVAIQQARTLANNLTYFVERGKFKNIFDYKDKGALATIGKNRAIAEIGKIKWSGWLAWLLWSTVHLFSITGFKNRLMVGFSWMIRYFTYEKANRLIIRKFKLKNHVEQMQIVPHDN